MPPPTAALHSPASVREPIDKPNLIILYPGTYFGLDRFASGLPSQWYWTIDAEEPRRYDSLHWHVNLPKKSCRNSGLLLCGSYEETHAFGLGRAAEPVAARPLSIPTTKNVNRAFSNTMTLRSTKNRARRAVALTRISSAGRAHASASDSAGIASDRSSDRCKNEG